MSYLTILKLMEADKMTPMECENHLSETYAAVVIWTTPCMTKVLCCFTLEDALSLESRMVNAVVETMDMKDYLSNCRWLDHHIVDVEGSSIIAT